MNTEQGLNAVLFSPDPSSKKWMRTSEDRPSRKKTIPDPSFERKKPDLDATVKKKKKDPTLFWKTNPAWAFYILFQGVPISIYSRVSLSLYIPGCPYLYIFQSVPISIYIPGCPYLYIFQGVPIYNIPGCP